MESERIRLAGLLAGWLGRPIHSGSLASSLPTSIMYRDLLYGRERGGKGGGGERSEKGPLGSNKLLIYDL